MNQIDFYVPRDCHSLNLVGTNSVNVCFEPITFFLLLSGIYAFFFASTHRWEILMNHSDSYLKNLPKTRWFCHDDATSAVFKNYQVIYAALSVFVESNIETPDARFEASELQDQMRKL